MRLVAGELLARGDARRPGPRPARCARWSAAVCAWFSSSLRHGAVADQRLRGGCRSSVARATSACALATSAWRSATCAASEPLLAYSVRTWRTVCAERRPRPARARPCASAGSSLHQRLAGLHEVGVVGVDRHHRAADLRRDLDHVALHVGVVGVLVVAGHQPFVGAPGRGRRRRRRRRGRAAPSCAWVAGVGAAAGLAGVVASLMCGSLPGDSVARRRGRRRRRCSRRRGRDTGRRCVSSARAARSTPRRRWFSTVVSAVSTFR